MAEQKIKTEIKSGFAFHVHHDILFEWCSDYDERVEYIKHYKPKKEQRLRLRLFKMIPTERLPSELVKAWEVYDKAREAYVKAWEAYGKTGEAYDKALEAYGKAREAYDKDIQKLHKELCPNCPWDGETIFSDRR